MRAFSEIGKTAYEFDLNPEAMQSGLADLDMLLAEWGGAANVRVGYAGGDGFGDINADTEVPDWAVRALIYNLAITLAPQFGKQVSAQTMAAAKASLARVNARTVQPRTRQLSGYAGSGSRYFTNIPPQEALEETDLDGLVTDF